MSRGTDESETTRRMGRVVDVLMEQRQRRNRALAELLIRVAREHDEKQGQNDEQQDDGAAGE